MNFFLGGNKMKPIKGTKTEVNLLTAFAGEAQARKRYTYFASVAKKKVMLKFLKY
jgi:rubrerythrin